MDRPAILSAMATFLDQNYPNTGWSDRIRICEKFADHPYRDRNLTPTQSELAGFVAAEHLVPGNGRTPPHHSQVAEFLIDKELKAGINSPARRIEIARKCAAMSPDELLTAAPAWAKLPPIQEQPKPSGTVPDLSDGALLNRLKEGWGELWLTLDAGQRRVEVDKLRTTLTAPPAVVSVADEAKAKGVNIADMHPNKRMAHFYQTQGKA